MHNFLKELPPYKLFLILRTRFFTDEKLKIQLSKRGHNLDKTLGENTNNRLYVFEVELLLREYKRRKLKPSDITAWAWALLYKAKFNDRYLKNELQKKHFKTVGDYSALLTVIRERRSVREWDVEKEINIDEIIDAIELAKWAPCSCNRQLWKFLIVTKKEGKDVLQLFTNQQFYKKAPVVIVPMINIFEYNKYEKHYADLDMGAIIQNLLLILHSKGFGACWIGITRPPDIPERYKQFCEKFNIDQSIIPVSIIPVGYSGKIPIAPPRKDTEDIINLA